MPSFTEIPRNSLVACLSMPEAVYRLGGKAYTHDMTQVLGRKEGGAWRYLVNSAVQHGLIVYGNGIFNLTPLSESIINAKEEERVEALKYAFTLPDIYKRLLNEFNRGNTNVERYLGEVEEFDPSSAAIVARNFIEGGKYVGLLPGGSSDLSELFSRTTKPVTPQLVENQNEDKGASTIPPPPPALSVNGVPSAVPPPPAPPLPPPPPLPQAPRPMVAKAYNGPVEKRVIQIPLPNNRVAELTIPSDLNLKDLNILSMQMEVLKAYVDNS